MILILKSGVRFFLSAIQRWGPPVLWMVMIYSASGDAQSVARSSRILEPLCRWFMPSITAAQLDTVHLLARKGAHMTEYAFLAILLFRALSKGREEKNFRWVIVAWVMATAYAASDELHQLFVSNRNGSFTDVAIDSSGAFLGLLACVFLTSPKNTQKIPKPEMPAPILGGRPLPSIPEPRCILEGQNPETQLNVRLVVDDQLLRENQGCLVLGRKRALVQLCVKNTSISAQHMALHFRDGRFHIEDRNSSNGTLVNGQQLAPFQPVALADGDRIDVGDVMLYFRQFA